MPALGTEPAVHSPGSERGQRDRQTAIGVFGSELDDAQIGERFERKRQGRALVGPGPADALAGVRLADAARAPSGGREGRYKLNRRRRGRLLPIGWSSRLLRGGLVR
jgi:hypothetical protein